MGFTVLRYFSQSIRDDFAEFATLVSENDKLEVALAVLLSEEENSTEAELDQLDDLESFFDEHGFEFIVSSSSTSSSSEPPPSNRIVDALSTIMWPSMIRKPRTIHLSGAIPSPVRISDESLEDISISSLSMGLQATELNSEEAMRREREAFEKWLDVDNEELIAFPQVVEVGDAPTRQTSSSGFEDDFSDFIQAKASHHPSSFTPSVLPASASSSAPSARDTHTGEAGEDQFDLFDDEDMPSASEIDSAMRQIFGTSQPQGGIDIASVFASLQSMKEEISGLPDEAERRKAAAKVALGLVYGLDGPLHDESSS